jgi:hypothetical protein
MSEEKQKRIEDYSQRSKFNRDFLTARLFVCPRRKQKKGKKFGGAKKRKKTTFCRLFTQRSTDFHHNDHHETETETETERFCAFVVVKKKKKKTTKRNRI